MTQMELYRAWAEAHAEAGARLVFSAKTGVCVRAEYDCPYLEDMHALARVFADFRERMRALPGPGISVE